MRSHARVVVIGGGIVGCSVAYHLATLGWSEVVLVERRQLASGSTWHAAGVYTQGNAYPPLARIFRATRELFEDLERSGHPIGFRQVGSLRLVGTPDRLDEMRMRMDRIRAIDLPVEVLDPAEVQRRWPLVWVDDLLAAEWYPTDGYVDPSNATRAIAERAIEGGAEIVRATKVVALDREPSGEWVVRTDRGPIRAETVINAGGMWAREIGELVGVRLPILPMEHEYVVTSPIPEIAALPAELPFMREPDAGYYVRQEGDGLLAGGYEPGGRPWGIDGIPDGFGEELLTPDLNRITGLLGAAAYRIPVFADAGIRTVVNGPDGYTPDHKFLMGEVPGRRGFWVLAGFNSVGIAAGGGAGRLLARWIVDGDPGEDVMEFDVRRFLPEAASTKYLVETVTDQYARYMGLTFPNEEPTTAARPLKCSPIYDRLAGLGARYGARNGWERALWFETSEAIEGPPSFRRPSWFAAVAGECRAVRKRVGIAEVGFAKFEVSGPGAEAFLDRVCANRLPALGRVAYTPILTPGGGFFSEFTVARVAPDRFYVVTSGASEVRDRDWLERWRPTNGGVAIESVTEAILVLGVAGPASRTLLERVSDDGFADDLFPFLAIRDIVIGLAPLRAIRLSITGELGWELHVRPAYLRHVLDRLLAAGADLGLQPFGYHALESLRLETGFVSWGHELTTQTSPLEAGLEAWTRIDKGEFVGRGALVRLRDAGVGRRLVRFDINVDGAVPRGEEPIFRGDRMVGHLASGGYGHILGRAIGYAYLPADIAAEPTGLEVELLGERFGVTVVPRRWSPPSDAR